MRNRMKFLIAAVTATVVLGAAVVASLANRLAGGNVLQGRVTFPFIIFSMSGFAPISCPVTLEGSAHSRTVSKVREALVGYVTSAFVNRSGCIGGTATVRSETLPWHVRYASFTGTLPNILTITDHLIGASFRVSSGSITCEITTTATNPAIKTGIREAGGVITSVTTSGTVPTSCFGINGTFSGSGPPTDINGARITVTLVQ